MKENIMSEELYNELLKAYSKEVLASMIKQIYAVGFPNLMQACFANNLMISKMLQISLNLQQKQ